MGSGSSIKSYRRKRNAVKHIYVRRLVSKFRKNNPKACTNKYGTYISKNTMVKMAYNNTKHPIFKRSYRLYPNKKQT